MWEHMLFYHVLKPKTILDTLLDTRGMNEPVKVTFQGLELEYSHSMFSSSVSLCASELSLLRWRKMEHCPELHFLKETLENRKHLKIRI